MDTIAQLTIIQMELDPKEALIISKTWESEKQADYFHYNWLDWE